jgi:uncharacterized membrane protein
MMIAENERRLGQADKGLSLTEVEVLAVYREDPKAVEVIRKLREQKHAHEMERAAWAAVRRGQLAGLATVVVGAAAAVGISALGSPAAGATVFGSSIAAIVAAFVRSGKWYTAAHEK